MQKGRLFVVTNCQHCPNSDTKLTKGFGYAFDRFCKAGPTTVTNGRQDNMLAGYIEWGSEDTKDYKFPDWCPLKKER